MKLHLLLVFSVLFNVSSAFSQYIKVENSCSSYLNQEIKLHSLSEKSLDGFQHILSKCKRSFDVELFEAEIDGFLSFFHNGIPYFVANKTLLHQLEDADGKDKEILYEGLHQLFYLMGGDPLDGTLSCPLLSLEADRFVASIFYKEEISLENTMATAKYFINEKRLINPAEQTTRLEEIKKAYLAAKQMSTYEMPTPNESPLLPDEYITKTHRIGQHLVHTGRGFPILKQSWNSKFYIENAIYAQERWHVIMTSASGYVRQAMRLRSKFPKDEIKEFWDEDYNITGVDYFEKEWYICMSKSGKRNGQRWRTRLEFPSDEIDKCWNDGYYLVDMAYGNTLYAMVAEKKTKEYETQTWLKKTQFPDKEINHLLAEKRQIEMLKFLNEEWIIIMTKFKTPKDQIWFKSLTFPLEKIKEHQENKYIVSDVAYGHGHWVIVMTKK